MSRTTRTWNHPIDSALIRKRSKLFVDGRLLIFPVLFGLAALLVAHDLRISLIFLIIAVLIYMVARWQFANFPYLIDDFQSEVSLPPRLADVGRPPTND